MLLQPKKRKHQKSQKGTIKGISQRGTELSFGAFGLKATEQERISAAQIESARKAINRVLKRKGRVWVRIFPHQPVTSKGAEVPMGGGKGVVSHFVSPVKPGRILFEIDGVEPETAKLALKRASHKLPIKTKFIT